MLEILSDPTTWVSLATLTLMEVVLGIDNIVFISIIAAKLPEDQQGRARIVGLALACITRLLLLLVVSWLASLTDPLLHIGSVGLSGRDLILLAGGAFLIYKATREIHEKLEGPDETGDADGAPKISFTGVIVQIILLDIVFSFDSVITAIGMAEHVEVMMAAVILALAFMVWVGGAISNFVMKHPTVKMLALSFLLLIGVSLAAEAFHQHIPKGYIYSAMAFSIVVEMLNLVAKRRREAKGRKKVQPVHLRQNVVGLTIEEQSAERTNATK